MKRNLLFENMGGTRRPFLLATLVAVVAVFAPGAFGATAGKRVSVTTHGAVGDGVTLNTRAIQAAIDQCLSSGGGIVVIPRGEFLSGALFFKGPVGLELEEGAVLKGSKNSEDYPVLEDARFEGHFQKRIAAFLNVLQADHFRLTGPGAVDGNGESFWRGRWPELGRPRLCAIRDSRDVRVSNVRFQNSPSWNLHLYNCQDSTVENCRFEIPDGVRGPSTDGIDLDSSQNIIVRGCYFSVDDDCLALKGNRYDGLNQEPKSPPVKNVQVIDCTFVRGHGALTFGTEAQGISEIEMKKCVVRGKMPMFRVKFRPDTPGQNYRNVHIHDIQLDGEGEIVRVSPYHGTKVPTPTAPISQVSSVVIENITGRTGLFGNLAGGTTATVGDVTLRNIRVTFAKSDPLTTEGVTNLKQENIDVRVVEAMSGK